LRFFQALELKFCTACTIGVQVENNEALPACSRSYLLVGRRDGFDRFGIRFGLVAGLSLFFTCPHETQIESAQNSNAEVSSRITKNIIGRPLNKRYFTHGGKEIFICGKFSQMRVLRRTYSIMYLECRTLRFSLVTPPVFFRSV